MRINGLSQTLIDRAAPGEGCAQVVQVVKEFGSSRTLILSSHLPHPNVCAQRQCRRGQTDPPGSGPELRFVETLQQETSI